ncbi:hypothetical protein CCACVL1_28500 [Corchorus capsularis]|uniref:Uncharacterized protein n=1 Tax=Corchorus capsularis TaxID=210143 RepID=A0A1R3G6A8_COCAP|nr:hypothetical protein CCACVL1_28500 [Corchorus capsularis]
MFTLHLYARWYLLRARRRNSRNRRRGSRRTQLVFYVDPNSNAVPAAARGLDARVLKSLPSSELCDTCQHEEGQAGSSASRSGRKLSIEVPGRNMEGFQGESSGCESGPSQSYKSPMSRMLSFKRILSRDRRGSGTSSCPSPIIVAAEVDIERGGDETRQQTQG